MFGIRRRAFGTLRAISSTKEKGAIGLALVRASTWNVVIALAFVALVEGLAALGRQYGILSALSDPADRDVYHGLALTVAGVGGALLGLYFAAMTVVLSGAYVDATSDVRRLLVFDRAGTMYTALVTIMVVASLAVVGMDLLGRGPAVVTVLAVTLVAALASASLLAVGARAFGLFDPVALGPTIRLDLNRWVREASSMGLGSSDVSFQTHYQRQANAALGTLASLTDVLVRRSDRDSDSLVQMGSHLLGAWLDYAGSKSSIALESRWFRRRYQHREWRNEPFGVDMALRTGTNLPPDEVGDEHWVETELAGPLGRVCVALAGRRDVETTDLLLQRVNRLLKALGQRLQVDEARLLWSSVAESYWPEIEKAAAAPEDSRWAMVATDLLALAPISIVVGVAQRVSSFDEAYVAERVDAMLRGRRRTGRGPAALDRELDWLREGIEFELAVEGQRVTPRWWLIEEASRSLVEFCCGMLPGIVDDHESQIAAYAAALSQSAKLQVIASFRSLELLAKLSVHADTVGVECASLSSARHLTSDPWPDTSVAAVQCRVSTLRGAAIRAIAKISPKLGIEDGTVGDEPDFFGRANAVLVDEVFRATLRGDAGQIGAVFPSAFVSALQAYEKLWANLDPSEEPRLLHGQILTAADPLADLLELSGYALLAAEVGHPQVWKEFESVWSSYLNENADGVELVFRTLRLPELGLGFRSADVARTGREMEFWRAMLGDEADEIRNGYGRTRKRHESPLVELTAFSSSLFKPSAAFASHYLAPKYSGDGDVPVKVRRFQEALEKELERRESD
ncbi:MAG: hypothetical protein DRQ55_17680 [Planctomycetota bacterium]|nr:MAG: hypothetical protein DRQ55_17680 [Planctomycetota bacterium]